MPKKRVYELAKELGLENKDLITHLERIGITVKSHSSSLEDDEVERIKSDLLAKEPRQVVEQRIKSTVIRRRAVRTPLEETKDSEETEVKAEIQAQQEQEEKKEISPEVTAPAEVAAAEAGLAQPEQEKPAEAKVEKAEAKVETGVEAPVVEKPKPQIIPVRPPVISRHKSVVRSLRTEDSSKNSCNAVGWCERTSSAR